MIANGAESEPTSAKDKLLLSRAPHLVLDGVALAAEAVGATRAFLCVHDGRRAAAARPSSAAERAGLNRVPIQVVTGARRLRGEPGDRADQPAERRPGHGPRSCRPARPSAACGGIPRWCRTWRRWPTSRSSPGTARTGSARAGPATAPGTALITVTGTVARPGVYEIDARHHRSAALLDRAGGYTEPPQAVLAGGYFGGWLTLPAAASVPLTDPALRAAGAALRARRAHRRSPRRPAPWPRPPGSPATWPARARASAARASTACPRWPRC